MIKAILFIIIALTVCNMRSQDRTEMAFYNIGLGSIFGGVGAVINKKPGEKTGDVLLKGMWQGALGGYLIYESKNLVSKIPKEEEWGYSWGAKFVNAAGTSIVENAASNRDFWEQWHLHIGFNRLEFYTKDKFKVKYKILPVSFILTGITATKTKFELSRSLQTGELVFSDQVREDRRWLGYTLGNVMVLDENYVNDYFVFSHEVIHVYQYYDYNAFNAFLEKPLTNWSEKSTTFNTINNLLHFDVQEPLIFAVRRLSAGNVKSGFENFFELEAEFYSRDGNLKD